MSGDFAGRGARYQAGKYLVVHKLERKKKKRHQGVAGKATHVCQT